MTSTPSPQHAKPKPNLIQQFANFTRTGAGLEKTLRLIQAIAQIAIELDIDPLTRSQCMTAKTQIALTRRYFRFFGFIDCFTRVLGFLGDGNGSQGMFMTIIEVARWSCMGLYLVLEDSTILHAMNIHPAPWNMSILTEAYKFWFYALGLSVFGAIWCLLFSSSQLEFSKGATAPKKQDEKQKGKRDPSKDDSAYQAQRTALWKRVVVDSCDLMIPGTFLGWLRIGDLGAGLGMVVSTVVSGGEVWKRAHTATVAMIGFKALFSSVFLAVGGFLFGYDSGIITSTISLPTFRAYFTHPSDNVTGGVVSAFQGGAIAGTMFNMVFADRLGRRRTIFVGALISCLGCALQAGSVNMEMLIIGRFIAGIAVGILTATIPMYAAELSEPKWRATLSGLLQWMLSWGFLVAQWLGYGCSFSSTEFSWRFPLAFQNIPGLILLAGIWFLNESPRWLMEKDRHEEARAVLENLRTNASPDAVDLEFREIRDVILADRAAGNTSWRSILTKPSWRKRLILGCGVQAFGPLSGINVINYYGPRIYEILGISNQTSLMIIGISGALSIVYCTIGLYLVDKFGRIKPLIVSAAILAAALLVNAVQGQYFNIDNGAQLRSMVAMNFVFSMAYTPLGIISWVYPAEIFPIEVRALGNAITTFTNWTVNLIFAQFTPNALSSVEFKYFYLFFGLNLIAMACYYFFYPETKGRTLEQIDELFGDQLVPHAFVDPAGAEAAMEKGEMVEHVERN
ncbi:hypothetical protein BDV25DRAFT_143300 [Aspergillus avenaceus]|uniref:Major facilitator superfamily (MFS) profile domain-containing protein n=1 Tax=Aspergillus avenaceus TaxID=36643 RepID=A0A5N6TKG3_ASPAV|nr:hypothetical protein BDV25DRAFT_143300 [Aspergillus avenaceus]